MNFDLSEEQRLLADSVKRYLDREYTFEKRKAIVASADGCSDDAWKTFAELGLLALPVSTEHGGFGGTAVDLMPVMQLLGEALVVEPYVSTITCARMLECSLVTPGAQGLVTPGAAPAEMARSPIPEILSAVAEGSLKLALAHTETDARYDLRHVALSATRDGDHFRLDGTKRVAMHAPQADRWLVSARTSGDVRDERGLSLFVVDPKAAGIEVTAYLTFDGVRGADIVFRDVRVADADLVGDVGSAFAAIEEGVHYGMALLCAEAVGAMQYACDATLEYLKTRKQFGVPIGSFQALQHRMVDMVIEKEQCLSMASLAAGAVGGNAQSRRTTLAAAALRVREGCERVSKEAIQLHGGMGMTEELKVSHAFKRLTALRSHLCLE